MGTCLLHLFKVHLSTYLGVGALHSPCQNSYLGAYPGVGAHWILWYMWTVPMFGESNLNTIIVPKNALVKSNWCQERFLSKLGVPTVVPECQTTISKQSCS